MRAIAFAMVAVLAMSAVASAAVTIGYTQNPDPGPGLRSFTVQATGIGISVLSKFEVTGSINQVWTAAGVQSEWLNEPGGTTPNNPLDSFVIFGDDRAPDLLNNPPVVPPVPPLPPAITAETITGGGTAGLGTLMNSAAGSYDGYFKTGGVSTTSQTEDLLQLIIPDGATISVGLTVVTGEFGTATSERNEFYAANALSIYSPWDGDGNLDKIVDPVDFSLFAEGWFGTKPAEWKYGDYNDDGVVDPLDFSLFANSWFGPPGPYAGGGAALAAIPEPGTIALLVMGALCLVGYRLRKK